MLADAYMGAESKSEPGELSETGSKAFSSGIG